MVESVVLSTFQHPGCPTRVSEIIWNGEDGSQVCEHPIPARLYDSLVPELEALHLVLLECDGGVFLDGATRYTEIWVSAL